MWQTFAASQIELEAWISDHYAELVKASRNAAKNQHTAQDHLNNFLEKLLKDISIFPADRPVVNPVGFFARAVHLRVFSERRDKGVEARVLAELQQETMALGPQEVGVDTHRAMQARADRKRADKASSKSPSTTELEGLASVAVTAGHLFAGQMGDTRWRYQTMRDNRLFDERAVRSLADSMHRASQSYRHDGEHGFAYSEFGQEVGR